MANNGVHMEEFPISYLLPKKETQAESFLKKYPEYDGENILIAIFDSGIDPGAAGLEKTVSGQPKIIDLIDCSGSGDVDTSKIVDAREDGVIEGKTGRNLKIPFSWKNPSGKYHIGVKDAFSLLPAQLRRRVQQERKEKNWIPAQNLSLADATRKLIEFERECPNPSTEEKKSTYEDLKQLVESLKAIDQKYEDVGPVYDCVVFHDGEMWRACVDTTETGDLEFCQLLGPFKLTGQYARLNKEDMMSFTINVYEDGNRLSIVTSDSGHGTHVASIAAAYFEEQPELNGVAPGAQADQFFDNLSGTSLELNRIRNGQFSIISMKIGDNRIDGMETGSSIIRAIKCAIDNKVDIINMSYGEAAKWTHEGRVVEAINKMVEQHNIIFLSSAGNHGPALSTLSCPGAVTKNVIAVGAYLSPDMMTAEYSVLEKLPGTVYYWSSNGPCANGSLGVSITAPGGAITSVPNWTLAKCQLKNGTSMASPNAAGCVGVLLSALKKEKISYSSNSIRRALENTALSFNDTMRFTQGYGLIQVEKSFEFMKELNNRDKFCNILKFEVSREKMLGIYIRENSQHHTSKYEVSVKPEFRKNTDNELRIKFNINTSLKSTESWVKCPKHLQLANERRKFPISIDSKCLKSGCHYAEVQSFDPQQVDLGPVFRVPITVIVPELVENFDNPIDLKLQIFKLHSIQRRFYFVPYGTTWATLTLTSYEKEQDVRYIMDVIQLEKDTNFKSDRFRQNFEFLANSREPKEYVIKLTGGYTVEVVIGRQWQVAGDTDVQATIQFHSLEPDNKSVTMTSSDRFTKVCVKNKLAHEEFYPIAELTHRVVPLIPKEKSLSPLSDRDLLPDNEQIYGMVLTYQFSLSKSHDVTIVFNPLSDLLYESKFESQLCMIYDKNKCLCGTSDAYPFRNRYKFKLDKGDFTAKVQVRHSSVKLLESLKDLPAELFISLPSSIRLDVYDSRYNLLSNTSKMRMKTLFPDEEMPVYIAAPAAYKYPLGMKPGEKLRGKISYSLKAKVNMKVHFPFQLIITSSVKLLTDTKNKDDKESKKVEDEFSEALQDFVVAWIPKLTGSEVLGNLLKETGEDSLNVLDAQLNALDSGENRKEKLQDVITLAKTILEKVSVESLRKKEDFLVIDEPALLAYLGMKVDPDIDAVKNKSEKGKLKKYYINSNYKLGLAAADMIAESNDPSLMNDLDTAYRNMMKVVGTNDTDMLKLTVRHGLAHKQYGRSMKALFKYFDDHGYTKEYFQTYIELVTLCGWEHIASYLRNTELMKFPKDYQLF